MVRSAVPDPAERAESSERARPSHFVSASPPDRSGRGWSGRPCPTQPSERSLRSERGHQRELPRERFGRSRCAARGSPSGANHPPLVDLLALASRSTSHRPSCPEARRAMPRYRPGRRLPGPVAVMAPSRCPGQVRDTEPAPRRPLPGAPVGVAHHSTARAPPRARPANRSATRCSHGGNSSRAPEPLTPTLPEGVGRGRFPLSTPPEGGSCRLGPPSRSALRSPVRGHTLPTASPQVKS